MILHTNYHGFRLRGFRQDFLHVSPFISLCKTCDPGAVPFWPQGYNLNKPGRGLLGDVR